jgi:hypothetical protein
VIEGWYKVSIVDITKPKATFNGDATGFWINMEAWVDGKIMKRSVWLSFDHQSEFVVTKSNNIGAMLRMMFPHVTDDEGYYGLSFWVLFKTYKDKKTGELKESFFDSKHNVSLDGKTNLYNEVIYVPSDNDHQRSVESKRDYHEASSGGDDPPF